MLVEQLFIKDNKELTILSIILSILMIGLQDQGQKISKTTQWLQVELMELQCSLMDYRIQQYQVIWASR